MDFSGTLGEILLLTLRLSIPIILAAIGATFSERSGVTNLGLEGMMTIGAVGAVIGVYVTGNPWMGVIMAVLVGGLAGATLAVLCIRYKANQVVSGVGINIIVTGLAAVLVRTIWNRDGFSDTINPMSNITIPVLNKIPIIGKLFQDQSPYLYLTIFIVVISWYIMYRTKIGLRLRALGDHPHAVETAGININKYRYVCVILSGMLAGCGGAYLSIVQNNVFVKNMVAGRGYMALAANIFGGWNPVGSFLASTVFAFAQAIRLYISDLNIPDQFIQMMPYVVTLLVLIGIGSRQAGPEALGDTEE